ncbi:hypothetical protein NEOLEDRAFT_1142814 [Neolentinus lepideus HHB14362 ss-1]|uniref:Uncharacterized protein n=1 Tax=Neolentinus lepideus HHB14362 ss-1 TaxID=1314782 RepID=A0A165MX45_9AGAM|nr:hypothetical protein NEOLEDRAFT_1142814 [Neolentinus lepideus HHB14362 ss-1]
MSTESLEFVVEVLLDRATDSVYTVKYQYLTTAFYEYEQSKLAYVSDLEETVLDAVRQRAGPLKIPLGGEMSVCMYELLESLGPRPRSRKALTERYKDFDQAYLDEAAEPLNSRKGLRHVIDSKSLIAVLTVVPPACPKLQTLQEVHEANPQIHRETIARVAQTRKSPSAGAAIGELVITQRAGRADAVYNYRPLSLTPLPITIYHPVFAKFLQIMEEDTVLMHDELAHALTFIGQAVKLYKNETKRMEQLSAMKAGVHQSILGITGLTFESGDFNPDGVVFSAQTPDQFKTILCITEVRNEIGEGGSDPISQAECAYVAVYSSDEARPVRDMCCCPAILIGMAGPHIMVKGAVFAEQLITQNLTGYISIVPLLARARSALDDASYRVARLFRALRECIKFLDEYYTGVVKAMSSVPSTRVTRSTKGISSPSSGVQTPLRVPTFMGPHFTEYYDNANRKVVLTYQKHLVSDMKPVFLAQAVIESKSVSVVVKFANTYNREAHELLANASPPQAPKLWHCQWDDTVWMWVVVMDYVEGRKIEDELTDFAHVESWRSRPCTKII